MTASWTLWRYLAGRYLVQIAFVLAALLGLVYLFEMIELLRRADDRVVPMLTLIWMGVLKLPQTAQIIYPFVFLLSGLIVFWQLGRSSELVVMRSSGISAWQFVAPAIITAFVCGIANFSVLQPAGAWALNNYHAAEMRYFGARDRLASLNKQGLWLRDANERRTQLMHTPAIQMPGGVMQSPVILLLDNKGQLLSRTDADQGVFMDKGWQLNNGMEMDRRGVVTYFTERMIPMTVQRDDVLLDFTRAEMLGSWSLPGHIETLAASGFPTRSLVLYYQNLLAAPFLWMAMALIAVAVSLTPHRMGRATVMIGVGVAAGFFYFLFARYFEALSLTQRIPEFLAAWVPVALAMIIPIRSLLQTEDG